MRKFFLTLFILFLLFTPANAKSISGVVEKTGQDESSNRIIDAKTKEPVSNAHVRLPQKNYSATTDLEGKFSLDTKVSSPTIMSVKKDGYKPFSLTVNEETLSKPIIVGIEKSNPKDVILENDTFHLGDDSFSENSANAGDFRIKSTGPFYTKSFQMKNSAESAYLVIGSIIGIDTQMAQHLGQSSVKTAYSSPPEVYFNGQKIAEIHINGDSQKINLPKGLLKPNKNNEVTIKTGRNLFQTSHIDYDDIEFTNLFVETP